MAEKNNITIEFNYIKSNYFRVIYAEGAWGGWNSSGKLLVGFYSDRNPIPKRTKANLKRVGDDTFQRTGPEEPIDTLEGMVREVEAEIVLDYSAAVALHQWLGVRLKEVTVAPRDQEAKAHE